MSLQFDRGNLNKQIYRLLGPAALDNLIGAVGFTIIIAIVSQRLGTAAIAAIGAAQVYLYILQGVGISLGVGATALVAQSIGAGEPRRASRYAGQAIMMAILTSLVITAASYIWARPLLSFLGATGDALKLALPYYYLCLWVVPLSFVLIIGAGVIRGYGDMVRPMVIMAIYTGIYVLYTSLVVDPRQPAPVGMVHTGWGAIVATIVGSALGFRVLFGPNRRFQARVLDIFAFDPPRLREIAAVSAPALGEQMVMRAGFFMFNMILLRLGTAAYAAHQLAVRIESLSFMPGFAFSMATTTLVGQAVGAGDVPLARLTVRRTASIGALIMGAVGLVLLIFPRSLVLGFFEPEPKVAALAIACVRISAFEQAPLAFLFSYAGALRGAGDTLSPMLVRLLGTVFWRAPVAYVIGLVLRIGLPAIWAALVCEWWMSSLIVYVLYRRGRWERTAIVQRGEGLPAAACTSAEASDQSC